MSYKKTVCWCLVIGLPLCVVAFLLGRHIFPVSIEFVYYTIFSFISYVIFLRQAYKEKTDFRYKAINFPIFVVVLFLVEYFFRGFLKICLFLYAGWWLCIFIFKLLKKAARGLGWVIFNIPTFIGTIARNLRAYIVSSIYQKIEVSKDNQSYTYNSDEETKITSDINAKLTSIEEIIKKLKNN